MVRTKNPTKKNPKRPLATKGPRAEAAAALVNSAEQGLALIGSKKDDEGDIHRLSQVNNAETRRLEFSSRNQFLNRDMRLTSNDRPVGSVVEPTEPIPITKHQRLHWLREVRYMQRSTSNCVPHRPFVRLSQEILSYFNTTLRMSREGAHALQEAAEAFLVGLFEDSTRCAVHAGRVTIQAKDMQLARLLSRQDDCPEFQDRVSTERVCQGIRGLGGVIPVRPI